MISDMKMIIGLIKRFPIKAVELLFFSKPLPAPTNREKDILNQFREAIRLQVSKKIDDGSAEALWLDNMNKIIGLILRRDPRRFLRWKEIKSTMFVGNGGLVWRELNHLKQNRRWKSRWRDVIKESFVGDPIPCIFHRSSSPDLIHHAYHLLRFEEEIKVEVNSMKYVFEFGGGYGSMCRLFFQLGFKGKYIIYDLPLFSALQLYFLQSIGIPVYSVDLFRSRVSGVTCISDLQQLKDLVSNKIEKTETMFISTWGLSEAPLRIRKSVLPLLTQFEYFLIAYQDRFFELNNLKFFKAMEEYNRDVKWCHCQIDHIKGSNYLFGRRC